MTEREQAGSDRAPAEVNLAFLEESSCRPYVSPVALLAGAGCTSQGPDASREGTMTGRKASKARLVARPRPASDRTHSPSGDPGLPTLRAGSGGLLCVAARPDRSLPLLVVLPGAGSKPAAGLAPPSAARRRGRRHPLSPGSCDRTWDAIGGNHGPDVSSIHVLHKEVFDRYSIDPDRLVNSGFSDGASYALSLGLANGDLFTDLIAFSPGSSRPRKDADAPTST